MEFAGIRREMKKRSSVMGKRKNGDDGDRAATGAKEPLGYLSFAFYYSPYLVNISNLINFHSLF